MNQSAAPSQEKHERSWVETVIVTIVVAILFVPALVAIIAAAVWRAAIWVRGNHEKAAENARDAAKGAFIVTKLALFWSWLVAPSGLAALATTLGLTSAPFILLATPIIVAIAGATATVAAALELYSKWRKRHA